MFIKLQAYQDFFRMKRVLMIVLLIIVIIALSWISTEQTIAHPGLRVLSWLWKAFVCRCLF